MRSFEFLPPIKSTHVGCLCCDSNHEQVLPMDTVLCNGFGGWAILKDGEYFFSDDVDKEWEDFKTLQFIENKAKRDTNHDWQAVLNTPLHGATYQRQRGKWKLVAEDQGFA